MMDLTKNGNMWVPTNPFLWHLPKNSRAPTTNAQLAIRAH